MTGQIPDESQRRVHALLSKLQLPLQFMNELIEHSALVSFARKDLVFVQRLNRRHGVLDSVWFG